MSDLQPLLTWKKISLARGQGVMWRGTFGDQDLFWIDVPRAQLDIRVFDVWKVETGRRRPWPTGHFIGNDPDLEEAKALAEQAVPGLIKLAAAEVTDG